MITVILVLFLASGDVLPIASFADDFDACERAKTRMVIMDTAQGRISDYQCVRVPKIDRNI